MKVLYLCNKKYIDTKMSRVRFHAIKELSKIVYVKYWGLGYDNYDNTKTVQENVDTFVVCESTFDHKGREKKINFNLDNRYSEKKVKHIILQKPFPKINNEWENQAIQREFILENINFANDEDYIFFSDPDEIPNPSFLKNIQLRRF